MPRQRFIWPSIWTSENFLELTFRQRLLFIGMFSLADDEGRIKASSKTLKASIFPVDDITLKDIEEDLIVLHNTGSILLYTSENERFAYFPKWGDFQHPRYAQPSKIPSPPPVSNTKESLTQSFISTDATLTQDFRMGRDGVGRVGMDRVGMDREIIHVENSIFSDSDIQSSSPNLNKNDQLEEQPLPREATIENIMPPKKTKKPIGGKKTEKLNALFVQEFEEDIWPFYPRKESKEGAMIGYCFWRERGMDKEQLQSATQGYKRKVDSEGTEIRFIKLGSTFYSKEVNNWECFVGYVPTNGKKKRDFSGLDPDKILEDYFSGGSSGPETMEVNNYRVEEMQ